MSGSPSQINVDQVEDISELKDYYRELQSENEQLKGLIADDRQRLQQIEYEHRKSVDQVALLRNQKESIEKQLQQSTLKQQILEDRESVNDEYDDISSDSDDNNAPKPPRTKDGEISRLKEEIEDLQLALAEERMLGMQLDFSNRQSAQRADTLQYQLAEEKLKNMHLQSSHQNLQLGDSNSSGFVHLRDSNNNDKDVIDNQLIDDDNRHTNKKSRKHRKHKHSSNQDGDDSSSTSDLSREFDLKIEEDPRYDDGNVDPEIEAKGLRHQLLDEQLKNDELKHRHRKSELQLMQYKEALNELRIKYEQPSGNHLEVESAVTPKGMSNENGNANVNVNVNDNVNGMSQEERLRYEAEIAQLRDQLEISKKKTMSLDKQRRDSLNIMSKNFFAKQLQAARDTHSLEEQLQAEIEDLKGQIYDVTKSKILLLQSTHDTIESLREHIVKLSNRLRKYENWDSSDDNNDNDATGGGYDVTDL